MAAGKGAERGVGVEVAGEVLGEVFCWGRKGREEGLEVRKKLGGRFPLFPRRCLSLVVGEPRTGKSLVTMELAARVSLQMKAFPAEMVVGKTDRGGEADEGEVAVVCVREDSEEMVKMRLLAAGADRQNFLVLPGMSLVPEVEAKFGDQWTRAGAGRRSGLEKRLEVLVKEGKVGVVVLDPLPAFFEGREDGGTVRRLLEPLVVMAGRYGFALVGVMHVKKNSRKGEAAIFRAVGTQAYVAMARSVMIVMVDDGMGVRNRRVVVPVKNNYAVVESAYAFVMKEWETEGGEWPVPYIVWAKGGSGHEWLRVGVMVEGEEERCAQREMAKVFLRTMVGKEAVASVILHGEARNAGISARTLTRANLEMGVVCWRTTVGWLSGMRRNDE